MDVSRVIRTQISIGELEPPSELVDAVNDGSVPLLENVKALGEYLTSTEDGVRLKGLTFLTNLIKKTAAKRINRQATQTLTRFYISKLDDYDSLSPTLNALIVLSRLSTFDDDAAVEVYQALCETVNMKAHAQAIRLLVYTIFDSLLANHRKALKALGSDFINSYTKMVDGEKDPRNLMLLFSMDRVLLLEFEVKDHIEDLFDITFCYFPISFRPPPNDPYGITADDLKLALRKCMAASSYFAKMAIPLFLEKFPTSTGPAMKDLMLTMAECFPTFGADAVGQRGTELWEAIKTEIMYTSDASIESAALLALEALLRTLYPTSAEPPAGLAQDIIKECLDIIQEPEKTQAVGATKILAALIRASPSTAPFAISQALPQIFRQFNRPALPSHRSPLLSTLSSLLLAARSVYASEGATRNEADEKSLERYKENTMDVLREGLRTDGLKGPAIRGSVALIEISGLLARGEVELLVKGLDDVLVNENDQESRTAVIKGLTAISAAYATLIETITLPMLFHCLPDSAPPLADTTSREKYRSILKSLSELCILPSLFEALVIRVNSKVDMLATKPINSQDGESADEVRECTIAYIYDLIHTLSSVIDSKLAAKHVDVIKYYDQIIPRLYGLAISAAIPRIGDIQPFFRDRRLLGVIARISETLTWELGIERQAQQFAAIYDAFEKGRYEGIVRDATIGRASSSSPLRAGAASSEQDLIAIYSSAVQGLEAEPSLPYSSAADYLASKVYWTIRIASDDFQVRWSLDLITAFVNKRIQELGDALEGILSRIWESDIQDTSSDFPTRRRALLVYLHIIKALSLIRHPLAYTAVDRLIEVLSLSNLDPYFVDEAARGLGVLAEGKGKGKGKESSHLTAKLLHAQKMWNYVLPKLVEGDKEASGKGRLPYLVAFSSLLPLVPASLCLSDLSTILPLILRSLSLPNPPQRVNAIVTLSSLLETPNHSSANDDLLHSNVEAMVQSLLKSAVMGDDGSSSGKCRSEALHCLSSFPDVIRHEQLRPLKSSVIRDLSKALDDPLRSVRKEAVECRARWYRLN